MGIFFLFGPTLYSHPISKDIDSLRVPIRKETYEIMEQKTGQSEIIEDTESQGTDMIQAYMVDWTGGRRRKKLLTTRYRFTPTGDQRLDGNVQTLKNDSLRRLLEAFLYVKSFPIESVNKVLIVGIGSNIGEAETVLDYFSSFSQLEKLVLVDRNPQHIDNLIHKIEKIFLREDLARIEVFCAFLQDVKVSSKFDMVISTTFTQIDSTFARAARSLLNRNGVLVESRRHNTPEGFKLHGRLVRNREAGGVYIVDPGYSVIKSVSPVKRKHNL